MGDNKRIKALAEQAQLMPQEELLAVQKRKNNLTISIPKETSFQEKRVALTPDDLTAERIARGVDEKEGHCYSLGLYKRQRRHLSCS